MRQNPHRLCRRHQEAEEGMTHYVTGDEYQHGFDRGLQEGERRGWERAIEAAIAGVMAMENGAIYEKIAAAIRKLRKE